MGSEETEKADPVEVTLVIVGTWCVLIVVLIVSLAIAHYSMSWAYVVYDLCSSSEGSFFYSVKIKTGKLNKELIDGTRFLTLDLLGTSGQFVTRLVVPFNEAIKNKAKAEKQDVTVTFKVGRKRRLPDIGRIRVDHELWGQQVWVHYIDIKGINEEEGPRHFRANVSQAVTMLNPAEVDVSLYQKDQVFETEHDINYPDGRPAVHPNLTMPECVFFLLFSVILVLCFSFWLPALLDDSHTADRFGAGAVNGAVSGLVAALIGLSLMLLFKFALKQRSTMCGMSLTGRFALFTLMLIAAVAITVATGIVAYNNAVKCTNWTVALLVGCAVLLLVGVPIGILIEVMSRKRATGQMVREESTVQQGPVAGPSRA